MEEYEKGEDSMEVIPGDVYKCESVIVPREKIVVNGDNQYCGYEVEDDITELALSIREYGLGTPLNVLPQEDGTYYLAGGNRRLKALRYGDQQGWEWFKEGYPCTISRSPISKDNDIDRKIYVHELNIHNRDNNANFFNLVRNLLELYREKVNMQKQNGEPIKYVTKKTVEMLSAKLGVSTRQGYTIAYIAENTDGWISEACSAGKITKECAYQVGHMPDYLQEELHKYFDEHGYIPTEKLDECAERKFLSEDAPDWLKDAVSQGTVSKKIAYKIGYSTKESKDKLKEYYDANHKLPVEIISLYLVDKKGKTITVDEIRKIEAKARENELIDSVTSGKVNLKNFKDPLHFEVEGLSTEGESEPFTDNFEADSDGDEDIQYNGTTYSQQEPDYGYHTVHHDSPKAGRAASYSAAYSEPGMEEEDESEYGYEDAGYEEEYSDDYDSTHTKQSDSKMKTVGSKSSSNRNNIEENSGKSKDVIMLNSCWWFGCMAENETMNETESTYLDLMFVLMEKFYFPYLMKKLQMGELPDGVKETLKKLITTTSPYLS